MALTLNINQLLTHAMQAENAYLDLIDPDLEHPVNKVCALKETRANRGTCSLKNAPHPLKHLRNMYASPFINYLRNLLRVYELASPQGMFLLET